MSRGGPWNRGKRTGAKQRPDARLSAAARGKPTGAVRSERDQLNQLEKYQRAQEAIEYLMENNGHVPCHKTEFAYVMAQRYGRTWLNSDGKGNGKLVGQICTMTRDQAVDPFAEAMFRGFVVAYAPNIGGMTLFDPDGEPTFDHLLHMLSGDMQQQQKTRTINRRRVPYWNTAAKAAIKHGQTELGLLMGQIEHEIATTGFASDQLVVDFMDRVGQLTH